MPAVRTTFDIPDEIYRRLKVRAAEEGIPVRNIVLRGIQNELKPTTHRQGHKRFHVPVISSLRPGTLQLTNEQIDDILASS